MNDPKRVILHCSATPDKGDFIGLEQIKEWHLERGWRDVGYHYIIRRSGLIEFGRPEDQQGAHTKGHNRNSLGICLVGTRDFTLEQVQTLKRLAFEIKKRHGIIHSNWFCHYQFANKDCPNIPVEIVRTVVQSAI